MARWLLSLGMLCLLFGVPESGWADTYPAAKMSNGDWQDGADNYDDYAFSFKMHFGEDAGINSGWHNFEIYLVVNNVKYKITDYKAIGYQGFDKFGNTDDAFNGKAANSWRKICKTIEFGDANSTLYGGYHGWLDFSDVSDTDNANDECYCKVHAILDRRYCNNNDNVSILISGKYSESGAQANYHSSEYTLKSNYTNAVTPNSGTGFERENKKIVYYGQSNFLSSEYYFLMDIFSKDPSNNIDYFLKSEWSNAIEPIQTSTKSDKGTSNLSLYLDGKDNYQPYLFYPVIRIQRDNMSIDPKRSLHSIGEVRSFSPIVFQKLNPVVVPGNARAKNVEAVTKDATKKQVTITWQQEGLSIKDADGNTVSYNKNGRWYIFRKKKNSDESQICLGDVGFNTFEFTDKISEDDKVNAIIYDEAYTYTVCFVPNGWDVENEHDAEGLYSSTDYTMVRDFQFGSTIGDNPDLYCSSIKNETLITLHWTHSAITDAGSATTYQLEVQRTLTPKDELSWQTIGHSDIENPKTKSGEYEDTKDLKLYDTYYYRLKIEVQDTVFYSPIIEGYLKGASEITSFSATRGTYTNRVKLQWNVEQVGADASNFVVSRRPLGSTDDNEFTDIYSTSGTSNVYNYEDETAFPGSYYEYKLKIYILKQNPETKEMEEKGVMTKTIDGYCIQTGVLSGRVSYGSGTAVEGTKIVLNTSDADGKLKSPFHSVDLTNEASKITYNPGQSVIRKLMGKDFSMQMYFRPSDSNS